MRRTIDNTRKTNTDTLPKNRYALRTKPSTTSLTIFVPGFYFVNFCTSFNFISLEPKTVIDLTVEIFALNFEVQLTEF